MIKPPAIIGTFENEEILWIIFGTTPGKISNASA